MKEERERGARVEVIPEIHFVPGLSQDQPIFHYMQYNHHPDSDRFCGSLLCSVLLGFLFCLIKKDNEQDFFFFFHSMELSNMTSKMLKTETRKAILMKSVCGCVNFIRSWNDYLITQEEALY